MHAQGQSGIATALCARALSLTRATAEADSESRATSKGTTQTVCVCSCTLRKFALAPHVLTVRAPARLTLAMHLCCCAGAVYQGMFGEWTVEPEDELEVFVYRAGISVAAAGLIASASLNCTPFLVRLFEDISSYLQLPSTRRALPSISLP